MSFSGSAAVSSVSSSIVSLPVPRDSIPIRVESNEAIQTKFSIPSVVVDQVPDTPEMSTRLGPDSRDCEDGIKGGQPRVRAYEVGVVFLSAWFQKGRCGCTPAEVGRLTLHWRYYCYAPYQVLGQYPRTISPGQPIQLQLQLRKHYFYQFNIYLARIPCINPASISVKEGLLLSI